MPRFSTIRNSFLAGEISPKAYGRTDLPIYPHACETIQNMIVMPQGGATRRPGTNYYTNTTSNNPCRLIPFIFNLSESYLVMMTHSEISIRNTADIGTTPISVSLNYTYGVAYPDPDIWDVQYVQSGDVMYLTHPSYGPQRLTRTATNTFKLEYYDYCTTTAAIVKQIPFRDLNTSAITLTPSALTGNGKTLTASAAFFVAGHANLAYFLLDHAGTIGCCVVTGYVSSTQVTINILNDFGNTTATQNWYESSWSSYRGYPRSVGFFESRIIYGGNLAEPDTFWGSMSENYNHMLQYRGVNGSGWTGSAVATDPVTYVGASQQANQCQWVSGGKTLAMGTLGSEHIIAGQQDTALSALSPPIVSTESTHGSAWVQARRIGYTIIYVQRSGRRLREITFDFMSNSYVSEDITDLAEHMFRKSSSEHAYDLYTNIKIMQIDSQETPNRVIWVVDGNGGLIGCTRDKQRNINAWHYHKLGGNFYPFGSKNYAVEAPLVRSIAVMPSASGIYDRVFVSVTRWNENAGANQNFVEYMDKEFEGDNFTDENPIFLDCAKVLTNGSPTASWTGATHLKGETVSVLADGFTHNDVTVNSSGAFTLDRTASKVIIGYKYTPILKLVRIEAGSAFGSSQGSIGRIDRAVVNFVKTIGAKVGSSDTDLEEIVFRTSDQAMNANIPLFTGQKVLDFSSDWDRDRYVYITSSDPLPLTVSHVTLRGILNEV